MKKLIYTDNPHNNVIEFKIWVTRYSDYYKKEETIIQHLKGKFMYEKIL